ncbi:MAG TPA: PQQ-binding-like beta-propeller repeat protein [Bryobacteraceae bacterium]|nr:PQQ-binding-like beta-propeller repeat protein [Bryobacteraceae bacterium]
MQKFSWIALAALSCAAVWGADWPTQSGSPQRDGWAKSEKTIAKDNVNDLDLLYKYRADNRSRGLQSLTSPLIDGFLITYLGFKEMLVFGGSADNVYSVDADLNRIIWKVHLDYNADKPQAARSTSGCPGGLTAPVTMAGSSSAGERRFFRRPARTASVTVAPAAHIDAPIGGSGFGSLGAFFVVSSDGYLHTLNTSTGHDLIPPVKFLPPNSTVSGLNINENVIYATTSGGCGGSPNALYAVNPSSDDKTVASFPTNGSGFSGMAGIAIGTDGTLYAQIASGHGDPAGEYHDTVLALTPKDLKVKDYFTPVGAPPGPAKGLEPVSATPVVFSSNGKDVIVAGGRDGRLYLLDSASLGGADHHTPLYRTVPIASADTKYAGNGFRGAFSSWEDTDTNTRWVYASLSGPPDAAAQFPVTNGAASSGSIVAFKVEERNGHRVLTPSWISRDMLAPAPAATANGMVFALATGESPREAKPNGSPYSIADREKMASHATLFVLDGATGKELYSSGTMVSSFSHGSGLAVANGRVYFTTHDNTVYCFGLPATQPQLTGR